MDEVRKLGIQEYSYTNTNPMAVGFDNTVLDGECFGCVNIKEGRFPMSHSNGIFWLDTDGQWGRFGEPVDVVQIYYCPVCGRKLNKD